MTFTDYCKLKREDMIAWVTVDKITDVMYRLHPYFFKISSDQCAIIVDGFNDAASDIVSVYGKAAAPEFICFVPLSKVKLVKIEILPCSSSRLEWFEGAFKEFEVDICLGKCY